MRSVLSFSVLLANMAAATKFLLPLYNWDTSNADWTAVKAAIDASSSTDEFTVIFNPDTGPVTLDDPSATNWFDLLSAYGSKANLIGYVKLRDTLEEPVDATMAKDQVATWQTWLAAGHNVAGLFFDLAPGDTEGFSATQDVVNAAKAANFNNVWLNQGSVPEDTDYYNLGKICAFENMGSFDGTTGNLSKKEMAAAMAALKGLTDTQKANSAAIVRALTQPAAEAITKVQDVGLGYVGLCNSDYQEIGCYSGGGLADIAAVSKLI